MMDPLAFLTWQFVMFALFVATLMYILRTVLEYFFPKLTTAKIWNSLLLMILPVLIGGFLGWFLNAYPYATGLTTKMDHLAYGSVAGLLSTIIFKVVKELLGSKISQAITGVMGVVSNVTGAPAPVVYGPPQPPPVIYGPPQPPVMVPPPAAPPPPPPAP